MSSKKSIQNFLTQVVDHSNYPEIKIEENEAIILNCIHLAQQLFPDHVLLLCLRSHKRFRFISDNCETMLGLKQDQLLGWSIDQSLQQIHPDDRNAVLQCYQYIFRLQVQDPSEMRFVLNYRLRTNEGLYLHVQDEKVAIKTFEQNFVFFTIYKNLTGMEKYHAVRLHVFSKRNNAFTLMDTYYPDQKEKKLTPRQNEIVKLVVKGFSNEEIAQQLHVSINTIKNHKQAVFRKVNIQRSLQLATLVN